MHMFNVSTLYRQSIKVFHQKLWSELIGPCMGGGGGNVYVLPYLTHCMNVACWHKGGGGDVQQPKNPGPKPIKCIFHQIRN